MKKLLFSLSLFMGLVIPSFAWSGNLTLSNNSPTPSQTISATVNCSPNGCGHNITIWAVDGSGNPIGARITVSNSNYCNSGASCNITVPAIPGNYKAVILTAQVFSDITSFYGYDPGITYAQATGGFYNSYSSIFPIGYANFTVSVPVVPPPPPLRLQVQDQLTTSLTDYGTVLLQILGTLLGIGVAYLVFKFGWMKIKKSYK